MVMPLVRASSGPVTARNAGITKPAGTVTGDLLIASIATDSTSTPTAPAGWERIGGSVAYPYWNLYTKVATASEPASYTWTVPDANNDSVVAGMVCVQAGTFDTGTPIALVAVNPNSGRASTSAHTHPGLTTTKGDALAFYGALNTPNAYDAQAGNYAWTAGLTERFDGNDLWLTHALATEPRATAGSTGTRTATFRYGTTAQNRSDWFTYAFVVQGFPTSTGSLGDPKLKEAILQFVSTAENGTKSWWEHFDYIEYGAGIEDTRGYTGGIVGWTTATKDMNILIKYYRDIAPGNVLVKWIPTLDTIDAMATQDERHAASATMLGNAFVTDWHTAASDPLFLKAQQDERDRAYWMPAYSGAVADGMSPLGLMIYYDTAVNMGSWPGDTASGVTFQAITLNTKSTTPAPAQGGNETTYLNEFLDNRWDILVQWEDAQTGGRVPALRSLLNAGNLPLNTPFSWSMYGTTFTIPAWPDPWAFSPSDRYLNDYAAITDSHTRTVQRVRTLTDSAGITDSAVWGLHRQSGGTSSAAITDSATWRYTHGRTGASNAAITDSASRIVVAKRDLVDRVATSDSISWEMSVPALSDYQFVLVDPRLPGAPEPPRVVLGRGAEIVVNPDGFDPAYGDLRTQDQDSEQGDFRHFGVDKRTPGVWNFEAWTDAPDAEQALGWIDACAEAWDAEYIRETPGAVMALQYRIAGRTRRIFGRPQNFAAPPGLIQNGRVPVSMQFRRAEDVTYDDEEQAVPIFMGRSGEEFPSPWQFPLVFPTSGHTVATPRTEQVRIGGRLRTWVVIAITGPVVNPWVKIGNRTWALQGEVPSGVTAYLSGLPWMQTVYMADGTFRPDMLDPRSRLGHLRFEPGTYAATFGGYDTTGTARAEVRWRNAYRGW